LMCFSAVAHGAEIYNKPDAEWVPRGNRTRPGWDVTIDGAILPGDDVKFGTQLTAVKKITPPVWGRSSFGSTPLEERL
jgi:hypothetical protein